MKIFLIILITIIGVLVYVGFSKNSNKAEMTPVPLESSTPVDITATFEIYTLGTKRVFTDSRYHNRSDDVYLNQNNPNVVIVKKDNTTWQDFFNTLPMKLTKECLTTGTGQLFCTNETRSLKFFINNELDPNALDKVISQNSTFKIVYD